jgi:hypothetical protein
MYAALRVGYTLEEVGRANGNITREAVRQRVSNYGLKSDFRKHRSQQRKRELLNAVRDREPEVLACWRRHFDYDAVAADLGLDRDCIKEFLDEQHPTHSLEAPERMRAAMYSDEELLELLRVAAAELGTEALSHEAFTEYGHDRHLEDGRPWPTALTLINRFGGWRDARERAGLARGQRKGPEKTYSVETCFAFVREVADAIGHPPSLRECNDFAQAHDGPSEGTLRNRMRDEELGWNAFRARALASAASSAPAEQPFLDERPSPDAPPSESEFVQIARRRGQAAFRTGLLNAYGGRCAISGCGVVDVLEAAHTRPWSETREMDIRCGLLLRADLHTLFDLGLLTIDPETFAVRVHLQDPGEYAAFNGTTIRDRSPGSPPLDASTLRR